MLYNFSNYHKNSYFYLHNYKNVNYFNNNFNENINKKTSSDSCNFNESEEVNKPYNYEPLFNFLGLNFQSDDLLIIGIILFLFKENCDDLYLYIALFLLLF